MTTLAEALTERRYPLYSRGLDFLRVVDRNDVVLPAKWKPQEDITINEFVQALDILLHLHAGNSIEIEILEALPSGVKRHFELPGRV